MGGWKTRREERKTRFLSPKRLSGPRRTRRPAIKRGLQLSAPFAKVLKVDPVFTLLIKREVGGNNYSKLP